MLPSRAPGAALTQHSLGISFPRGRRSGRCTAWAWLGYVAGGEEAREAAAVISKLEATLNASLGVQLLADIRTAFGDFDRLFRPPLLNNAGTLWTLNGSS